MNEKEKKNKKEREKCKLDKLAAINDKTAIIKVLEN